MAEVAVPSVDTACLALLLVQISLLLHLIDLVALLFTAADVVGCFNASKEPNVVVRGLGIKTMRREMRSSFKNKKWNEYFRDSRFFGVLAPAVAGIGVSTWMS